MMYVNRTVQYQQLYKYVACVGIILKLPSTELYCGIRYGTVRYRIVRYCMVKGHGTAIPYDTVRYSTAPYNTVPYRNVFDTWQKLCAVCTGRYRTVSWALLCAGIYVAADLDSKLFGSQDPLAPVLTGF
jgi:hypothetical protein